MHPFSAKSSNYQALNSSRKNRLLCLQSYKEIVTRTESSAKKSTKLIPVLLHATRTTPAISRPPSPWNPKKIWSWWIQIAKSRVKKKLFFLLQFSTSRMLLLLSLATFQSCSLEELISNKHYCYIYLVKGSRLQFLNGTLGALDIVVIFVAIYKQSSLFAPKPVFMDNLHTNWP